MKHYFYSSLPENYKQEIETIFYFNPCQDKFIKGIEKTVEIYGIPKLKSENNKIKIDLEKIELAQNLFLLTAPPPDGNIVAVAIHFRNNDIAEIIHIAIDDNYSYENPSDSPIFVLVEELKRIYHRVKGVKSINFLYNGTKLKIR